MDNKEIGNIKRIYYRNVRLSQIYGALSRKVKDSDTSLLFRQFSSDAFNHAFGVKSFIESHAGKVSIILRLLHEMDSFWSGRLSYYLGSGFVKKYIIKREQKLRNILSSIPPSNTDNTLFIEMINCIDEHIEKLDSL